MFVYCIRTVNLHFNLSQLGKLAEVVLSLPVPVLRAYVRSEQLSSEEHLSSGGFGTFAF